ncbi:MAG TPA: hypothetical protein VHL30_04330 [Chlamydiales bacterium]|jgi:YkoY family integral membrane protein|nr:hypothetical protein [Chlamydiales bacterium]
MLGQTFDLIDIARVLSLAFIEILLSADNAVILAMLSRALPPSQRQRVLYIGLLSAFLFRAGAILFVAFILDLPWIELLGAAYLIYLSIHHFFKKTRKNMPVAPASFWKTVFLIEFFDLAFAFDSIIAGVAFISTPSTIAKGFFYPKLWIVWVGGMIGLIFIRYAASLFSRLLERLPHLETSAYLLIGLIGIKLALNATVPPPGLEYFFWIAFAILLATSFKRPPR